eukprot:PhF_6_TR14081/c1_g1_i2/m.22494
MDPKEIDRVWCGSMCQSIFSIFFEDGGQNSIRSTGSSNEGFKGMDAVIQRKQIVRKSVLWIFDYYCLFFFLYLFFSSQVEFFLWFFGLFFVDLCNWFVVLMLVLFRQVSEWIPFKEYLTKSTEIFQNKTKRTQKKKKKKKKKK